ncbi:MAG TPA: hypothetical protein VEO01_40510 [Pseudonocardiaceae bacterium]|nr:hypothetical protein [Pseudonocardiaceae bacterium]
MHAKVKYLASTGSTGSYTQNKEYDVLGWTANTTNNAPASACVVDDTGTVVGVQVDSNTWSLSQAYATERIV